jgi:hypothetical protein
LTFVGEVTKLQAAKEIAVREAVIIAAGPTPIGKLQGRYGA